MYHHFDSTKNKIIGRRFLTAVQTDTFAIKVETDKGDIAITVHGDCCSESRFYDLVIPEECYGAEIIDVNQNVNKYNNLSEDEVFKMAWPDQSFNQSWEVLSIWDIEIVTKNGSILLRHVNNSNGYYDGMTDYIFSNDN
jgi:hypothetical protein